MEVSYMDDAPAFCGCLCQPCDGRDEDEEPCPCRGTGHGIQGIAARWFLMLDMLNMGFKLEKTEVLTNGDASGAQLWVGGNNVLAVTKVKGPEEAMKYLGTFHCVDPEASMLRAEEALEEQTARKEELYSKPYGR